MLTLLVIFVALLALAIKALNKRKVTKNVQGKVALITGGAGGLGHHLCIELATAGCNIAVVDIDLQAAQKLADSLIPMGVSAKAYKVDVSKYDEISALKKQIILDLGEVDILVNNAGLIPYKSIFNQSAEEIERLTRVNLNSVMLMTKCFLENMVTRKTGHIVTVTSLQGVYAHPHSMNYCATKFGATGFMMSLVEFLRRERLDKFIFTTNIMPNVIATREDLKTAINSNYKMLTPKKVAVAAVRGILKNEREVSILPGMVFGARVFSLLPYWYQHFHRDFIRQEASFLVSETA